jgi:hypothetical protein
MEPGGEVYRGLNPHRAFMSRILLVVSVATPGKLDAGNCWTAAAAATAASNSSRRHDIVKASVQHQWQPNVMDCQRGLVAVRGTEFTSILSLTEWGMIGSLAVQRSDPALNGGPGIFSATTKLAITEACILFSFLCFTQSIRLQVHMVIPLFLLNQKFLTLGLSCSSIHPK